MDLNLWELFVALFRDNEETTEEDENDRFVPSPLDLSVRIGHGGHDDEGLREVSDIREQASDLEEWKGRR